MADDLSEAHERLDYCRTEIRALNQLRRDYLSSQIEYRANPISGTVFEAQARLKMPIPIAIRSKIGFVVNEARSVLDHLANVLAARNGVHNSKTTYFPVSQTAEKFRDNGRKQIAALAAADQKTIEDMQPLGVTKPILWAFHEFDIARKHRKLGVQTAGFDGTGMIPKGNSLRLGYIRKVHPPPMLDQTWQTIFTVETFDPVRLVPNARLVFTEPEPLNGLEIGEGLDMLVSEVEYVVTEFD